MNRVESEGNIIEHKHTPKSYIQQPGSRPPQGPIAICECGARAICHTQTLCGDDVWEWVEPVIYSHSFLETYSKEELSGK